MQPLGIFAPASEALKKETIRCCSHSERTIQNKDKLLHPYLQIFVRHNSFNQATGFVEFMIRTL